MLENQGSPLGKHACFAALAIVMSLHSAAAQGQLEEIIVTAQKRDQSLQDVPISLNVVDGESLKKFSIGAFEELDVYIPNLYIKNTPGNNAIYMRGIGSSPGNLAFEQSVSLYVDNIYAGRGRQFQAPFLDVERVEVLRGPQGALVGKNSAAGAINIVPVMPTEEFEGEVVASYEFEREGTEISGYLSGPMGENFRARLALRYADRNGYLTNTLRDRNEPDEEDFAIRATGVWDLSETTTVIGKLEFSRSDNFGSPVETLTAAEFDYKSLDQIKETDGRLGEDFDNSDAVNGMVRINWDVGEHTVSSITGYSEYDMAKDVDSDFSASGLPPIPGVVDDLILSFFEEDFEQFSQEIRIASPAGQTLEYIAGAYFHSQDLQITRGTNYAFGPFSGAQTRIFSQDDELWSVYGQLTWNLSADIRAIISVRHTWEDKNADLERFLGGVAPPLPVPNNFSVERSENQTDPAATLQWDVSDDAMLYVAYAVGSKGGGFNGASNTATPNGYEYEDEESESIEVGAKLRLLGGSATFNVAVFFDEYKNMQRSAFDGASFAFTTRNAAVAQARGVEIDGAITVSENLTLTAAVAFLNAEYDEFPDSACIALPIAAPCTPAGQDIAGTTLPHAPDWGGNLALRYEQPLNNGFILSGDLVVVYQDSIYLDDRLDPRMSQDGYAKVDLRVGLGSADGNWGIAVIGKNLTDELTAQHGFETPILSAFGFRTLYTEPPRTVALEGTLRF